MTIAASLKDNPDVTLRSICVELKRVSEASESTSSTQLKFEDGSGLFIESVQGADCSFTVLEPQGD